NAITVMVETKVRVVEHNLKGIPEFVPVLDEPLRVRRLDRTRTRQVYGNDFGDPAGIPGHHHDLIRQKNRFVDAVRDKQRRFLVSLPDGEKLASHLSITVRQGIRAKS